jgi:hypothetical protein
MNADRETVTDIASEAARVRASGVLGQSSLIVALFDFLLEHADLERAPKESEIALHVFSRSGDAGRGDDATVRAYIHRLRRRLDVYYERPDASTELRLVIPRGEYRLQLVRQEPAAPPLPPEPIATPPIARWRRRSVGAGVVALVAIAIALLVWALPPPTDGERLVAALRRTTLWQPIVASTRPTSVILGDHYVFGDSGDGARVDRLIRDPAINSRRELDQALMANPDFIGHHVDVGVHYLPISAAPALQKLLPVITLPRDDWRTPRTLAMSEITADRIKLSNVLYIGMLSALGPLRQPLAARSAIVARLSGADAPFAMRLRPRGSDAEPPAKEDYAYLAAFPGPNGNRIVIIAGARDAGVLQAAEIATSAERLKEITDRVGGADAFEALFGVDSIDTTNVGARLIAARRLPTDTPWSKPEQPRR